MKKTFLLMAAILLAVTVFRTYAQEEPTEMKVFGMGLHFEQVYYYYNYSAIPAGNILFTITPMKNFRIEPEIGFSLYKDKDDDLTDQGLYYGAGIFGMYQKGKVNFYGGLRFKFANMKNEYLSYTYPDVKEEIKYNVFSIGPAIGAEFLFGKHFSLGGEIGLIHSSGKSEDSADSEESKYSTFNTETGVLLRFYF
jgi:hypothetical protein